MLLLMLMKLQNNASAMDKKGEFNNAIIKLDENGIYHITLWKQGWKKNYRFKAMRLNKDDELILEDDLIEE